MPCYFKAKKKSDLNLLQIFCVLIGTFIHDLMEKGYFQQYYELHLNYHLQKKKRKICTST